MGYLIAILFVLLAIFAWKIEKNIYNPAFLMMTLWAIIIGLYELKLFGVNGIEGNTYVMILMGIICFFAGYIVSRSQKKVFRIMHVSGKKKEAIPEIINYRLVKTFAIIVLLFYLEETIETVVLIRSGFSLFEIRTSLQGYAEYEFSNNLYVLRKIIGPLYTWVIVPAYNSILLLACIDFFSGKKDKMLITIAIINLTLKSFKEGSRVALFNVVIYVIFSMIIYGKTIKISRKSKNRIMTVTILLCIAMIVISNIRISQGQKSIFEEVYLYFTCCVPLLDYWIENAGAHTYGATSLYGIIQLPVAVAQFLTGHSFKWYSAGQQAIAETERFISIRNSSYSSRSNAYTTLFYYFYKDWGTIGVILGTALFAILCTAIYKKIGRQMRQGIQPKRSVFIYLLLIQAILLSFVRIYFSVASYSFTFLYAFLFIYKKRDSREILEEKWI